MDESIKCPLCEQNEGVANNESGRRKGLIIHYSCPRCGEYNIDDVTDTVISNNFKDDKYLLSGLTRESFANDNNIITLEAYHFQTEITRLKNLNLKIKEDKFLKYITQKTSHGEETPISIKNDYPLAYVKDSKAFYNFICELKKDGLLNFTDSKNETKNIRLTREGQNSIDILTPNMKSRQVFIARWFNKQYAKVWENGISQAVKEMDYEPRDMSEIQHNEKICEKIIEEIKAARFMIADFTGQRGGVYFEAGYAKSLGIPVIWCCHDDDKKNLHFDTNHYNHIFWNDSSDESINNFKEELKKRIKETIT